MRLIQPRNLNAAFAGDSGGLLVAGVVVADDAGGRVGRQHALQANVRLLGPITVEDVFPSYYKANTRRAVSRLCLRSGLSLHEFRWLSQYPSSFMFSATLFRIAMVYEKLISRFNALAFLRPM